jgi:hypothetical protein
LHNNTLDDISPLPKPKRLRNAIAINDIKSRELGSLCHRCLTQYGMRDPCSPTQLHPPLAASSRTGARLDVPTDVGPPFAVGRGPRVSGSTNGRRFVQGDNPTIRTNVRKASKAHSPVDVN